MGVGLVVVFGLLCLVGVFVNGVVFGLLVVMVGLKFGDVIVKVGDKMIGYLVELNDLVGVLLLGGKVWLCVICNCVLMMLMIIGVDDVDGSVVIMVGMVVLKVVVWLGLGLGVGDVGDYGDCFGLMMYVLSDDECCLIGFVVGMMVDVVYGLVVCVGI